MMHLYIGNKNYSSWSMRVWILMKHFDIPFEEFKFRLTGFGKGSDFKKSIRPISAAAKVPVLVNQGFTVWDSMAIFEYLADQYPHLPLWPTNQFARAHARSICAEMHSGFMAVRSLFPMNIEARLPEIGRKILVNRPDARLDIERILNIWTDALQVSDGPMLFGDFGVADACFAPVVMRFDTYGIAVPRELGKYMERVKSVPAVNTWIQDALEEQDFIEIEEPYRTTSEIR